MSARCSGESVRRAATVSSEYDGGAELGEVGLTGPRRVHFRIGRRLAAQRSCPSPVDRAIDNDPVQPRAEGSSAIEPLERPDRGEKRLLGDVLGGGSVVDDQIGGTVSPRPVAPVELLERLVRSSLRGPDPAPLPAPVERLRRGFGARRPQGYRDALRAPVGCQLDLLPGACGGQPRAGHGHLPSNGRRSPHSSNTDCGCRKVHLSRDRRAARRQRRSECVVVGKGTGWQLDDERGSPGKSMVLPVRRGPRAARVGAGTGRACSAPAAGNGRTVAPPARLDPKPGPSAPPPGGTRWSRSGESLRISLAAMRVSGSENGCGPEYWRSQGTPMGSHETGKFRFRSTPRPFRRVPSARPSGFRFGT